MADLLLSADPRGLDDGAAKHLHHLLGLALLNLGEPEQARLSFERGAAIEGGSCDLAAFVALATPLAEPPTMEVRPWTPEQLAARGFAPRARLATRKMGYGAARRSLREGLGMAGRDSG